MPLDAVCLSAVVEELKAALEGGKIDKIYQPGRDEVVLAVRGPQGNGKLLLSASPSQPRAQMTTLNRENPDKPPMFCMLLRKHLTGGRILEVSQPPMERLVDFRLETLDELGDRVERRLILECMGRRANLILLDEAGRIVDCLRRVDADLSAKRQVLPGLFYRLPPAPEKCNNRYTYSATPEERAPPPSGIPWAKRPRNCCWTLSLGSRPSSPGSWPSGRERTGGTYSVK